MSCDGSATGRPSEGLRMLFDEIMSSRASIWLSNESGTCTAIWSPSKSALKDRKSTRLNSSHTVISYAVFCLKKKKKKHKQQQVETQLMEQTPPPPGYIDGLRLRGLPQHTALTSEHSL